MEDDFLEQNKEVANELLKLLKHLNDSMDVLTDLTDENRGSLVDSLDSVVKSFQTLRDLGPTIKGYVPSELIQEIDNGNSPDLYAQKLIGEYHNSEKKVENKQKCMKEYNECLKKSIDLNFPDLD